MDPLKISDAGKATLKLIAAQVRAADALIGDDQGQAETNLQWLSGVCRTLFGEEAADECFAREVDAPRQAVAGQPEPAPGFQAMSLEQRVRRFQGPVAPTQRNAKADEQLRRQGYKVS